MISVFRSYAGIGYGRAKIVVVQAVEAPEKTWEYLIRYGEIQRWN